MRMTGKRPGAGEPSAAAGREMSAYRRVPSRITIGTSLVVLTPGNDAGPGSKLRGASAEGVAANAQAGRQNSASAPSAAPASRRPPRDPAIAVGILAVHPARRTRFRAPTLVVPVVRAGGRVHY